MSEWREVKIGDIAEKIAMGPFGSNIKVETFVDSGVPVISGSHLRESRLRDGEYNFVTEDHAERMRNSIVFRGDVIFTHAGNISNLSYIPESSLYDRYVISQRQFYLRCNLTRADPCFITYFFHSPSGRHKLLANSSQVGVPSIAQPSSYLKSISILLPPLHEQKAIAHILSTLDDKIDQLRKTNSVLEDMASALFKSWFIDFDPVKAKQENRPTGLTKDLDDLFPDSFEDSALGPIPTGWRVAGLASTGEFLNGLALQKYPGDVLPVIKIPQLRQNSTEGADKCSDGVAPQYVIDDGDLLFSWSGTLVAGWWTAGKGALNQHLFKVSSGELSSVMLKHWIDHHLPWFRLVASSKAVTMGHIKRSHLDEAKVVIPSMALNDHAQTILADYRDKFIANGKHIRTLTNLRDTLLPKLISGDLRVPEAEQMVAELGL